MRIVYNRFLPVGKRFYAINLFGVLFSKGPCSDVVINHEKIHTAQMRELLYLPFYIVYVLEWLIRMVQYGGSYEGYRHISFEREAYENENELSYLQRRRRFSFLKHLSNKN